MNPRLAIIFATLAAIPWLPAQNTTPEPPNPLLEAFRSSEIEDTGLSHEITVVLDPPAAPPEELGTIPPAEITSPPLTDEIAVEAPSSPPPGLTVRVEKLQTGSGSIDPADVKLLAPFPAKLLAQPPAGWHLESSKTAPPFTREVELSSGSKITLTVNPHLLVPEADGSSVFQVAEPGYNAALGYRQDTTVGAILSTSILQLENDSKQLGGAIEQLQQLLVSLPQPAAPPQPAPEPAKIRKK